MHNIYVDRNMYASVQNNSIHEAKECFDNYLKYAAKKDFLEGISNLYVVARFSMAKNTYYSKNLWILCDYLLLYPDKSSSYCKEILEIVDLIMINDEGNADIKIMELIHKLDID